jgi:LmbE family N-acetylglucosaminyl deacetylase
MKIVVLSAHRGDAALSVGLGVAAWLAAGHAVELIACCTRSQWAPYSDAASVHANDRMSFVSAVRRREDEAWAKLCPAGKGTGRLTLTDLNLKDAPLRLHIPADEVFGLAVNLADKAFAKIQRAVERSAAHALVAPLALDGHIDRLTARTAALAAWTGQPLALYEDLPQAASIPTLEQDALSIAAVAGVSLAPAFADAPKTEAALDAAVARKRRLAWCYDSQLDEATTAQVAGFCRAYAGRERLWAGPAWRASELAAG